MVEMFCLLKTRFVGLSSRTNMLGCEVLRESFPSDIPIVPVPVVNNLHFKCSITAVDENNLVVAETDVGQFGSKRVGRIRGSRRRIMPSIM